MSAGGAFALAALLLALVLVVPLRNARARRQALAHVDARLGALADGTTMLSIDDGEDDWLALPAICPQWLALRLVRAGVLLRADRLAFAGAALLLLALLVFLLWGWTAALSMLVLPVAGALLLLDRKAARAIRAFVADLPLLLDSVQQSLKVGQSLQQALTRAVEGAGANVRQALLPAVHRIAHGVPVADALGWAARRLDVRELHMFAAAVQVNARHGGAITAILANLANILRQAARTNRELKAATAETRFSGVTLMAMPLVIIGLMAITNPDYVRFFIDDERGPRLAMIALGFQLAGMVLMRRLMRLDF